MAASCEAAQEAQQATSASETADSEDSSFDYSYEALDGETQTQDAEEEDHFKGLQLVRSQEEMLALLPERNPAYGLK